MSGLHSREQVRWHTVVNVCFSLRVRQICRVLALSYLSTRMTSASTIHLESGFETIEQIDGHELRTKLCNELFCYLGLSCLLVRSFQDHCLLRLVQFFISVLKRLSDDPRVHSRNLGVGTGEAEGALLALAGKAEATGERRAISRSELRCLRCGFCRS